MAKGGYRKPANPAPVSGPGSLSRRTDGKQPIMEASGGKYGERKALREMQAEAPMAQTQQPLPQQQPARVPSKITPLFAPTERPNEPVTAGLPFGEGPNSNPANINFQRPSMRSTLLKALSTSDDPDVEAIYNLLYMNGEI